MSGQEQTTSLDVGAKDTQNSNAIERQTEYEWIDEETRTEKHRRAAPCKVPYAPQTDPKFREWHIADLQIHSSQAAGKYLLMSSIQAMAAVALCVTVG